MCVVMRSRENEAPVCGRDGGSMIWSLGCDVIGLVREREGGEREREGGGSGHEGGR